ncbi:hypothetical protein [Phocoenobacter atlanticus]|uniref:hypothetical protein n=1 Tax=Phocoenobacter atlanticus TaxID=3416742 RepID=UPI00275B52E1|nr:hypothetical protein [Pasteurella atlantica]MDP8100371.1 hypothetical protein [Pasteurella atlantica]
MNIIDASEIIKKLYRETTHSKIEWDLAIKNFNNCLLKENNLIILEQCILNDPDWELHVEGRLFLLDKAKRLGACSRKFLIDYYGYLSAHLDPSERRQHAEKKLEELL